MFLRHAWKPQFWRLPDNAVKLFLLSSYHLLNQSCHNLEFIWFNHFHNYAFLFNQQIIIFTCPSTALWLWSPGCRQFFFPTLLEKIFLNSCCISHLFHYRQQCNDQHAWSTRSARHNGGFSFAPRGLLHLNVSWCKIITSENAYFYLLQCKLRTDLDNS